MSDTLTPEQEVLLDSFIQQQIKISRSIEPINHEKAEAIITKFYGRINLPKPEFRYYNSPVEILSTYPDVTLDMYFGGQQWLHWKSMYAFAEMIGEKYSPEDSELLADWMEEAKQLHWWFPFEGICLISERPIKLEVNETGVLQCENGMAFEYADGFGAYFLNGVAVPDWLVTTDAENLDINKFLKEENTDVKAEFVRKYGVERMLNFGNKIDSYENYDQEENPWWWKSEYELWDMHTLFPGLDYQPYLKMTNQTTGIFHVEALSPAVRTISDALKERFGGREMRIVSIS